MNEEVNAIILISFGSYAFALMRGVTGPRRGAWRYRRPAGRLTGCRGWAISRAVTSGRGWRFRAVRGRWPCVAGSRRRFSRRRSRYSYKFRGLHTIAQHMSVEQGHQGLYYIREMDWRRTILKERSYDYWCLLDEGCNKTSYDYKNHVKVCMKPKLITCYDTTLASVLDSKLAFELVDSNDADG